VNWSTIVVWPGALVAGAEVAALQIRRTLAVSDATASIAIAIAWVVAWVVPIAIAWVVPVAIVVTGVVALAPVVVSGVSSVAIVAGEPPPRRPFPPSVVWRAAARLVVVVEATVAVVAVVAPVVAPVGKVATGPT